ncbi:ubiquitin-conjugating enzyme E2 Q2-like [Physella acuta]|uniref:ubiquitin-conjugating enzyme E2 Q2-like n=1 Tax=Physella acuta TaxID=109671 RepID=UPI0027DBA772|nr:ubiquitin-conjugating enzyme E2 Q2-like [Physella acuta]XP_059149705.1 ubiquitin-conjugating enzyme E2 Q2-like [Physella acuta]XP_059149706.1 ubiquitin-conjugating enzyme E2 Q2-like [Physella acuta]XP_059149707.1 ubiquitin-conjugating enzyme E2 Q2-like [Physella acuta]XP_059149708.1 ubiquitin-conjugating enzyme E2 Q2-like [Physella acuta]XP_059149709.1 ubiquitin-conjugating enzyme E2 Q2-like [Physella acuta]
MDFHGVQKEAKDYLSKSSCGLVITAADEINSQIHFKFPKNNFSFYITTPGSDHVSWSVWSDTEDSHDVLQLVLESCDFDSCKTVSDVLDKLLKCLEKVPGISSGKGSSGATALAEMEFEEDENDDEEDFENYYAEEDCDAKDDRSSKEFKEKEAEKDLETNFFKSSGSEMAVKRLIKDLKAVSSWDPELGIEAHPRGDDLFVWNVKFKNIPKETKLGGDLNVYAQKYKEEPVITLDMQFPTDYPFSPPFIRVLKPRFKFLTGHVTIGGSICMQMLTKSGWRPCNDIESVLIQVRTEILSDEKASLDINNSIREYTESEAKSAFKRMVDKYGW